VNTYLDPDPGFDDHNFKYFTVFKKYKSLIKNAIFLFLEGLPSY
jgi:hypothetical protein